MLSREAVSVLEYVCTYLDTSRSTLSTSQFAHDRILINPPGLDT